MTSATHAANSSVFSITKGNRCALGKIRVKLLRDYKMCF